MDGSGDRRWERLIRSDGPSVKFLPQPSTFPLREDVECQVCLIMNMPVLHTMNQSVTQRESKRKLRSKGKKERRGVK